jgi:hypothetical protein
MNFSDQVYLEESNDPLLATILSGCILEADITINCDLSEHGAYLNDIEIDGVSFPSLDPTESTKAGFLLNEPLMDVIKKELTARVRERWDHYEEKAFEWVRDLHEWAIERNYEAQMESYE